jgi:hypothetical protein
MFSVALKAAFFLTIMCGTAIALPHTQPYDDSALRDLLVFEETCPMPCWQGIRLGITSLDDALERLNTSVWVDSVQKRAGYRHIWTWSDQNSLTHDNATEQQFLFSWREGIVDTISMQRLSPLWQLWLIFGRPDAITVAPMPDDSILYIASYEAEQIHIFTPTICGAQSQQSLWRQSSRLDIGRLVFYPTARPIKLTDLQWIELFRSHPFCLN